MVKGQLANIIAKVRTDNNLPANVVISEGTMRQRLNCESVFNIGVRGQSSPLLPLEHNIVATIVQMSRI